MRRKANDINIAPLVDVLLVLLVIFMVTAPMLVREVLVDLPQVVSYITSTNVLRNDQITTISLDDKKNLFLNGKKITLEALLEKIKKLPKDTVITLEASKALTYQVVYFLLMQLKDSGFYNIALSGYY